MNIIVAVFATDDRTEGGKCMALKSAYMKEVYEKVCKGTRAGRSFLQAVQEVLESLEPVVEKRPDIKEAGIVERIVEPAVFAVPCFLGG